ncbi:VP4 [Gokushovirus WZ-2015a]|nr:VP4 [Gokushovirus WZ-2015a]
MPCGKCIECRLKLSAEWALRCQHESYYHEHNSFITYTYDDEHLKSPYLVKEDFTRFIKSFRKRLERNEQGSIRFLYSGEYGSNFGRPHFHMLCFGHYPDDVYCPRRQMNGSTLFQSHIHEDIWHKGMITVGSMSGASSAYVAKYSLKKQMQNTASLPVPDFIQMSRMPGIGYDFYQEFKKSMFDRGFCIQAGFKKPIPRYYWRLLREEDKDAFDYYSIKKQGYAKGLQYDLARLDAREKILLHKLDMKSDNLFKLE